MRWSRDESGGALLSSFEVVIPNRVAESGHIHNGVTCEQHVPVRLPQQRNVASRMTRRVDYLDPTGNIQNLPAG